MNLRELITRSALAVLAGNFRNFNVTFALIILNDKCWVIVHREFILRIWKERIWKTNTFLFQVGAGIEFFYNIADIVINWNIRNVTFSPIFLWVSRFIIYLTFSKVSQFCIGIFHLVFCYKKIYLDRRRRSVANFDLPNTVSDLCLGTFWIMQ